MCAASLDHLVGESEQRGRNVQVDNFCCFQIDYQFKSDSLPDGHVAWLFAFEDAPGIHAQLPVGVREAWAVAHQPTGDCPGSNCVERGNLELIGQPSDAINGS